MAPPEMLLASTPIMPTPWSWESFAFQLDCGSPSETRLVLKNSFLEVIDALPNSGQLKRSASTPTIPSNASEEICASDAGSTENTSETTHADTVIKVGDAELPDAPEYLHYLDVPQTDDEVVQDNLLPSKGSALHWTGQCQQCLYFKTKAGCKNGSECTFCHSPSHSARKRRPRPCKAKRERFRRMLSASERVTGKESMYAQSVFVPEGPGRSAKGLLRRRHS